MWVDVLRKGGALKTAAILVGLVVPGCTIHLGPGQEGRSDAQTSSGHHEVPDSGNPSEPTPEELAAYEAIVQSDPEAIAIANAKIGYAAYFLKGTIETLGLDPNTVDADTLNQLVDQYFPLALDEANKWVATADVSKLPTPSEPKFECGSKFGCPYRVECKNRTGAHSASSPIAILQNADRAPTFSTSAVS